MSTDKTKTEKLSSVDKDVSEQSITDLDDRRRAILKTGGVAGAGVAASAVWTKPALEAVMLPAHAGMSDDTIVSEEQPGPGATTTAAPTTAAPTTPAPTTPAPTTPAPTTTPAPVSMMLSGSSGTTAQMVLLGTQKNNSIAESISNLLVSEAKATTGDSLDNIFYALVDDGEHGFNHCLTLDIEDVSDPDSAFTLTLDGPTIYYYDYSQSTYFCYSTNYASYYDFYNGSTNFSGSVSGTLSNREIDEVIGDICILGTVDETFENAAGTLLHLGGYINSPISSGGSGYGAYWDVSLGGGNCSIGNGQGTEGIDFYYGSHPYCDDD